MTWSLVCEIVSPVVAMTFYIIMYASNKWVVAGGAHWGLWTWCSVSTNGTTNCSTIDFFEAEGYFKAVRIISSFTLIVYICSVYAVLSKSCRADDRKRKTFPMLALSAGVLSVTIIGILAENFKNDRTFRQYPSCELGWCVWLHVAAASLTLCGGFMRHYNNKKWSDDSPSLFQIVPARTRREIILRWTVTSSVPTTTSADEKRVFSPNSSSSWQRRPGAGSSLSGLPDYDQTPPRYQPPTSPPPSYDIALVSADVPPPDYVHAIKSSGYCNSADDNLASRIRRHPECERPHSLPAGVIMGVPRGGGGSGNFQV